MEFKMTNNTQQTKALVIITNHSMSVGVLCAGGALEAIS
jgi:hypothetical protein